MGSVEYGTNFPPARYLHAETSNVSSVFIARGYLRSNAQNRHPFHHLPFLCQDGICGWKAETFRFHVNCIHLSGAVFVHVGPAQLCA